MTTDASMNCSRDGRRSALAHGRFEAVTGSGRVSIVILEIEAAGEARKGRREEKMNAERRTRMGNSAKPNRHEHRQHKRGCVYGFGHDNEVS